MENQTNTQSNFNIETLQQERAELMKQLESLKTSNGDNETLKENNTLREENESLKKLIEEYKTDLSNATKFAQQVMLEYGSRKEQQNEMTTKGQQLDKEYEEYKAAEEALNSYLKSKQN